MINTILGVFIERVINLVMDYIKDYLHYKKVKKKLKLKVQEIRKTEKDPKRRAALINGLLG